MNLDLPQAVSDAKLPGSKQIPPLQALLALLAPKLIGKRRISHICDLCKDEGAGLFAGPNVSPVTTYVTDYSDETERAMTERLIAAEFADYWEEQTGHYPARLLFNSRVTTYAGLGQLTVLT